MSPARLLPRSAPSQPLLDGVGDTRLQTRFEAGELATELRLHGDDDILADMLKEPAQIDVAFPKLAHLGADRTVLVENALYLMGEKVEINIGHAAIMSCVRVLAPAFRG